MKGQQKATATDLLEAIVSAETAAVAFYDRMVIAFEHHPSAKQLWEAMRADEEQHLAAVNRIRAHSSRERSIPASDLAAVLRQQETLTEERIRAIRDLHDAYELAHELESLEMDRLGPYLSRFVPASDRAAVLQEVLAHQARLAEFRRTSPGWQWMRSVPARQP